MGGRGYVRIGPLTYNTGLGQPIVATVAAAEKRGATWTVTLTHRTGPGPEDYWTGSRQITRRAWKRLHATVGSQVIVQTDRLGAVLEVHRMPG